MNKTESSDPDVLQRRDKRLWGKGVKDIEGGKKEIRIICFAGYSALVTV